MAPPDQLKPTDIVAAQSAREKDPKIIDKVIREMQSSAVFQFNWEELLISAPIAIHSIGAIYAATSSPHASTIKLSPPSKGFKHLSYTSLRANLVECGGLGTKAFLEAEARMAEIRQQSVIIFGKVADIVECLSDPPTAKRLLPGQMATLQNAAEDCHRAAQAIDEKFQNWLDYVVEFHAACVQKSTDTEDAWITTTINIRAEQERLTETKKATQNAKQVAAKLGKQLDTASEAFKKAAAEFPDGWDLLLQQIVGDLTSTVTTALNQGIPALLSALNPIENTKNAYEVVHKVWDDLLQTVTDPGHSHEYHKPGYSKEQSHAKPNVKKPKGQPHKKKAADAVHVDPRPKDSDDPAYAQIMTVMVYLETLDKVLSNGKDGGVDWNSVVDSAATASAGKANSTIIFLLKMIVEAKNRFRELATDQEPSKKYMAILETAEKIASELKIEADKGKEMSNVWPKKDSKIVRGWQKAFAAKYAEAVNLYSVAKTLPGNTSGQIPTLADSGSAEKTTLELAKINAKSTHAQALLNMAQNRLNTTQQAFITTQQVYQKSTELLVQQQNKMAEIRAQLVKLTKSAAGLEEVKRVLRECIKLILNLKEQITKLVRFFSSVSITIGTVVKFTVKPFLRDLAAGVALEGTDTSDLALVRIGDFTLGDFQRTAIFSSTLTIRAYFGLFGEIANMWVKLSKDHIFPGISLTEELGLAIRESGGNNGMKAKLRALETWSKTAQEAVQRIAGKKRKDLLAQMKGRIEDLAADTKALPPPPPRIQNAIAAGAEKVKEAAESAQEQNYEAKPFVRFDRIPDNFDSDTDHDVDSRDDDDL